MILPVILDTQHTTKHCSVPFMFSISVLCVYFYWMFQHTFQSWCELVEYTEKKNDIRQCPFAGMMSWFSLSGTWNARENHIFKPKLILFPIYLGKVKRRHKNSIEKCCFSGSMSIHKTHTHTCEDIRIVLKLECHIRNYCSCWKILIICVLLMWLRDLDIQRSSFPSWYICRAARCTHIVYSSNHTRNMAVRFFVTISKQKKTSVTICQSSAVKFIQCL